MCVDVRCCCFLSFACYLLYVCCALCVVLVDMMIADRCLLLCVVLCLRAVVVGVVVHRWLFVVVCC